MRFVRHQHPSAPRVHVVAVAALLIVLALVDISSAIGRPSPSTEGRAANSAGALPERRFAPCGALDPEARRLVVFGGRSEAGVTHFADAWALDLATEGGHGRWEQVAAADAVGAPPPTRSCAAAWDSGEDRLVVFGGWNGTTMRNGVWALDVDSATWSQLCDSTSCGTAPSPRRAAAAGYDPLRDQLVVFGGLDGAYRNEVWTLSLDGSPQWHVQSVTGVVPTGRASHTMTYDAGRDRMWVVGGTTTGTDLADTWALDLMTMTWQRLTPGGCPAVCPSPRSGHVAGYDDGLDRIIMYGGLQSANGVAPPEAWALSDLDGTGRWNRLDMASAVPQARFVPVGAFDEASRRLVVFGGGLGISAYRDTVSLHLPLDGDPFWRSIAPATPFTARDQAATVLADGGVVTMFGGFGSGSFPGAVDAGLHLADTWQLPLATGGRRTWHDVTGNDPARVPLAREAAAVADDRARDRTFLVGGLNGDVSLNDVWVARTGSSSVTWEQLCSPASCGTAPEPRWGGHAVWDERGDRVVVFGGRRSDGSSFDDTWALELTPSPHWVALDVGAVRPPARWGGAVGYDPRLHRMVVFGGQTGNDSTATPLSDTWSLSLGGEPRWTQLEPTGTAPSARRSPAYATVSGGRRRGVDLLVTTGFDATTGGHHNDVWRLSLGSLDGQWTQLSPDDCAAAASPACRRSASAVWDATRERLVLLVGRDADRFYDDVWMFDPRRRTWAPLAI